MMAPGLVIGVALGYMALLFGVAYWGERRAAAGKSLLKQPWVYALSLAVYCTAWTYYGSVGRAATNGIDFLAIYLGPTLTAPLWWWVLRKIIRITKVQRLTTLADFISARYGKSATLGGLVALCCLVGVIPYIALQLKAISTSFSLLSGTGEAEGPTLFWNDSAFYIAAILAGFTILFGTRTVDVGERHDGLVTTIAFESIIKLIAFLLVGLAITFGLFGNAGEIFRQAADEAALRQLFTMPQDGFSAWFTMIFLSALAIIFLPRQFQVAVIENTNERHLDQAVWQFPLYLFLINIFVLPIALGGRLLLGGTGADADAFLLTLPLAQGWEGLTLLAFLGGFSAATSMTIVSTIALSVMVSNNLLMPALVTLRRFKEKPGRIGRWVPWLRRAAILGIVLLAYAYHATIGQQFALVSLGLISFAAVAQFAPAALGGIFWKGATRKGALWGLVLGFTLWAFTLVLPTMVAAGQLPETLMTEGLWGQPLLKPYALLGLEGLDPLPHGVFWSLFANGMGFMLGSLFSTPSSKEVNQAEIFVNIFQYSKTIENSVLWKGTANAHDLQSLLVHFLGRARTHVALEQFNQKYGMQWNAVQEADARLVNYAEGLLAGVIGTASARILVASVVKEEEISLDEVFDILRESQQLMALNQELREKSRELNALAAQLRQANDQLVEADRLKDEFMGTVTHEMKTPLTAIRSLTELLHDNDDMETDERAHFLGVIISEVDRMTRLITQILDLERFASGKQQLNREPVDLNGVVREAATPLYALAEEEGTTLALSLQKSLPSIMGDADRLAQVVVNLLGNALKFCRKPEGKVAVASFYLDGELHLTVTDNGKGIDPEGLPYIFDKFYQAKNQTIKKPKGSGLGLAISKQIVEWHGGRIGVESSAEKGTRFTVTLPAEPLAAPAALGKRNPQQQAATTATDNGDTTETYT